MHTLHAPLLCLATLAAVWTSDRAPGQVAGLRPGTFVASTMGYSHPNPIAAGNAVLEVDLFARTSTPLAIAGFPSAPGEIPWLVEVESRLAFLLGTQFIQADGTVTGGALYRVVAGPGGWVAARLNTTPLTEGVCSAVTIGDSIHFTTTGLFSTGAVPSCKLWQLPRGGGAPGLVADLSALGAPGIFGALGQLGSTLHLFTFVSEATSGSAAGEHWAIDTSRTPAVPQRVGTLPTSSRTLAPFHLGALGARWDGRTGAFVIPGVYGEILWRDPLGNDVRRRTIPGRPSTMTDYLATAVAIDTDTGSIVYGDKDGNLEELRTQDAAFRLNSLRILPSNPGYSVFVIGLSYVPGAARYLPDLSAGCPRAGGAWPVNYVASRPGAGNAGFAFTLDAQAPSALLLIGSDNAGWNGSLLPLDLGPLGAPGCGLGTAADIAVLAATAPLRIPVPLPATRATLYTQWAILDPPANALGLVLSDSRRMEIR
jgi:hypothetical protein